MHVNLLDLNVEVRERINSVFCLAPIVFAFPVLLAVDEPLPVYTEVSIVLQILVSLRSNLGEL